MENSDLERFRKSASAAAVAASSGAGRRFFSGEEMPIHRLASMQGLHSTAVLRKLAKHLFELDSIFYSIKLNLLKLL